MYLLIDTGNYRRCVKKDKELKTNSKFEVVVEWAMVLY